MAVIVVVILLATPPLKCHGIELVGLSNQEFFFLIFFFLLHAIGIGIGLVFIK